MEWRPIETAPKDGTRILIWPGCWPTHWEDEIRFQDELHSGWLIVDCEDPWYTVFSLPEHVTHWVPMPEGPANNAEERG
jgi:hypothetical protein